MLITVYSESPQNWFTILAIDVYELVPNVPITAVVNDAGRAMYEFIAPKDVTNIVITLQTFVGDANMYVGTEPFLDKSGKYQWMSELESPIDSVTVSFLNVTFSTSLYIIVKVRVSN